MSTISKQEGAGPHLVTDVKTAANGHWPEVLAILGVVVPPRKQHGPCPVCGGRDRFRFDDKGGDGRWICGQGGCDKAGDGLDLVVRVTGQPVAQAARLVAGALGLSHVAIDPAERERLRQQQQARAEQEQQRVALQRRKAASKAARIMADCQQGVSPYLEGKGLQGVAVALSQHVIAVGELTFPPGSLVVPLYADIGGELVNVQLIDEQGRKSYLAGGQMAGACHRIAGSEWVAVCEGYATGLSIHLATGASVYCAMNAGNLLAVAQRVRGMDDPLQPCRVILCADNDANTPGNPGKSKAEQAASAIGARVALPPEAGDWNDYHQAHGLTKTKEAIMGAAALTTPIAPTKTASQEKQGATPAEVATQQISANARAREPEPSADVTDEVAENELPEGFILGKNILFAKVWVGKGDEAREELIPISIPIRVLAETSGEAGFGHGRLLEWRDSRGNVRRWAMPMRMLVTRGGDEVFSALLDSGASYINLGKKQHLRDYLMACKPTKRITCVERTGWHGGAYVLPKDSIGPDAQAVILQTTGFAGNDFTQAGTLAGWQHEIAAMAIGNSRLCFALSMAFAAPLLSLVGMEGGGFHLKGESTDGKTTIMKAAASVYGAESFSHTWRATGNAIEGIASRRNDALLCLDEIGELDGREAGQTAYMLANGQGKGRSKQDGELRDRKQWRLLFLSTGELSLEDHVASAGQRTQAGMEVRTLQIPSDTGKHGAFEQLHGLADGRTFADTLKASTERQYGTAFRAYAQALAADLNGYRARAKAEIKRLADELLPKEAGNQVGRAINRFALVAAAGELASELGITDWPAGEATRAAKVCLNAWLAERGHLGNQEDAATLRQIRQFFTANQYASFADWYDTRHRPSGMVGYRRGPRLDGEEEGEAESTDGMLFYVLPEGWKQITKGRDHKKAAKLAFDAGWFAETAKPQADGVRLQVAKRLPGNAKPAKVYLFSYAVIADADAYEDEGEDKGE